MAVTDGYRAGHRGMSGQAGGLDGSGDGVGRIRKAVGSTSRSTPDALGGSDTGPGFNACAAARETGTEVLEAALHELADTIRLAGHAYRGSDLDVRPGVHSLSAAPAHSTDVGTVPPTPAALTAC